MASNDTVQPATNNYNSPALFDAILASVQGGISTYRATAAANEAAKINPNLNQTPVSPWIWIGLGVVVLYAVFEA